MYVCIGTVGVMERYGGAQATEGSSADPVAEWSSPGGETGLEGKSSVSAFQFHFNFG